MTTTAPFSGFDLSNFWEDSDFARSAYVGPMFNEHDLAAFEGELGYKLPSSYIALMRSQNGGIPRLSKYRTSERTSWADDHVALTGIYSIGREQTYSLCGEFNSAFWVEEWGYPPIGIYFADCPSAGHDMLCLDYRECGPQGEPAVVHVDQENDYKITYLAKDFESFIRGLEGDDAFET
ncbi:SMI1/KNR4 family protein [Niveibacterium sp. COAC-50]|uniref:SMI1/KNR4 family protein n=1 Tax=Niveibacterium sp. COAC-50 TaxID=2729384 RepID=UPI0015563AA3|nr:SMI1/KNR4 family protein [Niveibacterium sp. COAC-50]